MSTNVEPGWFQTQLNSSKDFNPFVQAVLLAEWLNNYVAGFWVWGSIPVWYLSEKSSENGMDKNSIFMNFNVISAISSWKN